MDEKIGLYLDDCRIPIETPPTISEWVVVKSYDEFKQVLYDYIKEHHKIPYLISFDHDLAEEHYDHFNRGILGSQPPYLEFKEKTGAHAAKLLTAICEKNNLQINKVCVHSHNPVGALNIQTLINGWKKEHGQDQDCFMMKFKFKLRDNEEKPADSEETWSTTPTKDIPALGEHFDDGKGTATSGDIPSFG